MSDVRDGDALTAPFWEGARLHELRVQHCAGCGAHQWYPRPFCIRCGGAVSWIAARGTGRVYSRTIIRVPVVPTLTPPYLVALVELDEGPRMLTNLTSDQVAIGDRVRVEWRPRDDGPPLPVFGPAAD
jgi:uncharacterized OB-fold protein